MMDAPFAQRLYSYSKKISSSSQRPSHRIERCYRAAVSGLYGHDKARIISRTVPTRRSMSAVFVRGFMMHARSQNSPSRTVPERNASPPSCTFSSRDRL